MSFSVICPCSSALSALLFISICAFFVFPALYITNEGISGGMVVYIVFGAVVISLLLKGKAFVTVFILYIASAVILVVLDYWDKQNALNIIRAFESDFRRYYDMAAGIVLGSIGLSLIILFQNSLYDSERQKVEAANQANFSFLTAIERLS